MEPLNCIAFVGFGEAGRAFAQGVGQPTRQLLAHDIKLDDPRSRDAMADVCSALDVRPVIAPEIGRARTIFSLVTADQAVNAAQESARHLAPGTIWLDGNSCAPDAKRKAAAAIEAVGGIYIDMAVMAPVHPRLHRTPVLLSGPHADKALAIADVLGMDARIAGNSVGDASAVKMLRSVIIKGLEALTAEAFIAGRRAGVEQAVIASLQASDPGIDWAARGSYNIERMLVHGRRRAAEMQEVAATLRSLGLPDTMASATVQWQAKLGELGIAPGPDDISERTEIVLRALE